MVITLGSLTLVAIRTVFRVPLYLSFNASFSLLNEYLVFTPVLLFVDVDSLF